MRNDKEEAGRGGGMGGWGRRREGEGEREMKRKRGGGGERGKKGEGWKLRGGAEGRHKAG